MNPSQTSSLFEIHENDFKATLDNIDKFVQEVYTNKNEARMAVLHEKFSSLLEFMNTKQKNSGLTPLHMAALSNNQSMVKELIYNVGNIDAQCHLGETPLHKAAKSGHQDIVQMLLENGAYINAQCKSLQTPLHKAAIFEKEDILRLLIKYGADVNAMSNLETALNIAARKGLSGIAQILLDSKPDIECKSNLRNVTPLFIAAAHNHIYVLDLLIRKGANIHAKDSAFQETALHEAAHQGHVEIARVLLNNGINIDEQDIGGNTPLSLAAGNGKLEIAKLLIGKGASIELDNPLFKAVYASQIEIVEFLLNNGANIDGKDFPVHAACGIDHNKILQLLLHYQPNLSKKNSRNYTSQEIALENKRVNSLKMLSYYKSRSP